MRELLLRGEFRPGERLREIPLAARLKVSRTPLRLVLDRLEQEGLLTARPTGGFVAAEFTVQDIHDGIEIRGMLEGTAAKLAAERLESLDDLADTRKCLAKDRSAAAALDVRDRLAGAIHHAQRAVPHAAPRPGAQRHAPPRRGPGGGAAVRLAECVHPGPRPEEGRARGRDDLADAPSGHRRCDRQPRADAGRGAGARAFATGPHQPGDGPARQAPADPGARAPR